MMKKRLPIMLAIGFILIIIGIAILFSSDPANNPINIAYSVGLFIVGGLVFRFAFNISWKKFSSWMKKG